MHQDHDKNRYGIRRVEKRYFGDDQLQHTTGRGQNRKKQKGDELLFPKHLPAPQHHDKQGNQNKQADRNVDRIGRQFGIVIIRIYGVIKPEEPRDDNPCQVDDGYPTGDGDLPYHPLPTHLDHPAEVRGYKHREDTDARIDKKV